MILLAFLGSAWRRWFGSARPSWAYPGYRATQIAAGFLVLGVICSLGGGYVLDLPRPWGFAKAALATGFMTLPIQISRRPFEIIAEWLVDKGLPVTKGPTLQGAGPWAEVFQGFALWGLAIIA